MSQVAEHFISAIEESNNQNPLAPLLICYDPDEVRRQAVASTQRFKEDTLVYTFLWSYTDTCCCAIVFQKPVMPSVCI